MVYSTSSTLSLSSPRAKAGFPAPFFGDMPPEPQSFVVPLGSFLGTKTNFNNFQRCVNFNMIAKTVSVDHSRVFFTWQSLHRIGWLLLFLSRFPTVCVTFHNASTALLLSLYFSAQKHPGYDLEWNVIKAKGSETETRSPTDYFFYIRSVSVP